MKERPIIFSGQMVRAILDGRKTMTRRVVNPQPRQRLFRGMDGSWWPGAMTEDRSRVCCPYGVPSARLWVREAWRHQVPNAIAYRADEPAATDGFVWRSPIHMPRSYSRITLEVVSVRVERLQEVTDRDAIAEGIAPRGNALRADEPLSEQLEHLVFRDLWDSINGKRHPWESNPWTWVIEFRRVE